MSEAMSSVEIEDVLSSIRRLVSQDLRPGQHSLVAAALQADKTDIKPQVTDKLILTPAFRVVTQAAPTPPSAPPPPASPLPRLHLGAEPVTRVVASTLERAVEAQSTEWESEVGDPPLLQADMPWTDAVWSTPTAEVVQFPSAAPLSAAEISPASWAQVDPETVDADLADATPTTPIIEPDRLWADRAEAEAVAALDASEPAAMDPSAPATDNADPQPADLQLDEQVLREMVRDMILAELQGDLGERMTRNIRKLVRAEIARAMAAYQAG